MGKEITMGFNFNLVAAIQVTIGQIDIEHMRYIHQVLCKLAGSGES